MQKSNVRQIERPEVRNSLHNLNASSIDAANVLSIVGLIFGSVITYALLFSRPAAFSIERATADEAITHVQAASGLAP